MTLAELKTRCEGQGFLYAYGLFKKPVNPPFLTAMVSNTDNFMADDKVWHKDMPIQLNYVYEDKNIEEMNKIEDNILGDIAWNKSDEVYLENEHIWQVSYFFEI